MPWDADASWGPNWNEGIDYSKNAIFAGGGKPAYKTPSVWSLPLCAPRAGAALRVIRLALFPGAAQFRGYRGSRTKPPHPARRVWTALKLGVRLAEGFCSLCWRALRNRSAR